MRLFSRPTFGGLRVLRMVREGTIWDWRSFCAAFGVSPVLRNTRTALLRGKLVELENAGLVQWDRDEENGTVQLSKQWDLVQMALDISLSEDDEAAEIQYPPTVAKADSAEEKRIFIGHGRSPAWLLLKDFVVDRLGLSFEEFNRVPAAGYSTKERLEQMLARCSFAFAVMTGEDEDADGKLHARENVIHEVGLCQGRYGFAKTIVLLEEHCTEFSNVQGLTQIRFSSGDILSRSEEIRRVLEREKLLP